MDGKGLHGLSCRYSAGRHPRHSAMNDVVKRSLLQAGLTSVLDLPGLDRGDMSRRMVSQFSLIVEVGVWFGILLVSILLLGSI